MTQPTRPESYESAVIEAIERALDTPGGIRLTFDTKKAATTINHRIYGCIKALRLADHPLGPRAAGLMIKRPNDTTLHICRRDETELAKDLRKALDALPVEGKGDALPERPGGLESLV